MTTRPSRAGSATQSAASSSGAARDSVFWIENQRAEAAAPHQLEQLRRRFAEQRDEDAEQRHADDQRGERDDEGFRAPGDPFERRP